MIAWTVLAVAVLVVILLRDRRRPRPVLVEASPVELAGQAPQGTPEAIPFTRMASETPVMSVFLAAIVCGFVAWIGSQMAFSIVAPPRMPVDASPGAPVTWRPIELAVLALLAGVCGWAGSFAVLRAARLVRLVGYTAAGWFRALVNGAVGIFVSLPLVHWTAELTAWTLEKLKIEHATKHPLLRSIDEAPDPKMITLAALAAVVAAPMFEELLFRGLIQNGITRATRLPWVGILIASALFALIHPWWSIPPIFVLSVLLGIVYMRTQNLWAVTLMHALFNAFMMAASAGRL